MTIDPTTVPIGAVVQCDPTGVRTHLRNTECPEMGITRVFVPVPDGMTYADAEAALVDAGAWVGVIDPAHCPDGARMMNRWTNGLGGDDLYVHRDDLPPTDPDADLIEAMARGMYATLYPQAVPWDDRDGLVCDTFRTEARAALAALREHEAKS